jgi:aryl-alcohol dehydrogenase-like predicted oxidoreductase
MPKRTLEQSGLEVSAVGLGADAFGISVNGPTVKKIISAASDHGITLIDTAYMYGGGKSEEYIGNSIQGRRDDFVIATKGGHRMDGGPTRRNLIKELEVSLKHLKTDYGVLQDDKEAVKWYRLAAEQGNATAQNNLRQWQRHFTRRQRNGEVVSTCC